MMAALTPQLNSLVEEENKRGAERKGRRSLGLGAEGHRADLDGGKRGKVDSPGLLPGKARKCGVSELETLPSHEWVNALWVWTVILCSI